MIRLRRGNILRELHTSEDMNKTKHLRNNVNDVISRRANGDFTQDESDNDATSAKTC